MKKQPILVSGSHRSGTTWVGKMIDMSKEVAYIQEPFNKYHRPGICSAQFDYWFPYIKKENEDNYIKPLRQTMQFKYNTITDLLSIRKIDDIKSLLLNYYNFFMARKNDLRPLLKDPIAIFSAEWLYKRFETQVIILIRHPVAFASSLKRLNWNHPFKDFIIQPLIKDIFNPYQIKKIKCYAENPPKIIDQAILLWNLIYSRVKYYKDKYNKKWLFLKHEDISLNPDKYFRMIYEYLQLEYTDKIRKNILKYSSTKNPKDPKDESKLKRNSIANINNWENRLTKKEAQYIEYHTKKLCVAFYRMNNKNFTSI